MRPPRGSTMLAVGLVLSLVLHVSILLPALVSIMKSDLTARPTLRADFDAEDFRPPEVDPDSIDLGIDESDVSTMTWIGFDDYKEHLAALAEIEQAAFQTTPAGAEPAQAAPTPTPAETPLDGVDARTPPESPPVEDPQPDPPTSPDPFEELEAWLESTRPADGPPAGEPTMPDARAQALQDVLEQLQHMMENPVETQQPQDTAKPDDSGPPQPPQPPQPEPRPAGQPGEQAEQESDATSILEVSMEELTLGRPLSAQGLKIRPRKPVFTMLTLFTSVPSNPTAELRFRRDGKPARVRLLEKSGYSSIDESVINSLYRWRASGEKLRELKPGQTIPVRIRIMLNRSR